MKVILVHGWGGSPEADWFPWAVDQLKKDGHEVMAPEMPNTDEPSIEEWVPYLESIVKDYDEGALFIGHSIGCQTIMRFLEKQDKKARGAIFVAGWFNLTNLEDEESEAIAKPWIETPINTARVRENLGTSIAILSENDPFVPFEETKKDFEEKLGSKVVIIPDGGHITTDDGFGQFPLLIEHVKAFI